MSLYRSFYIAITIVVCCICFQFADAMKLNHKFQTNGIINKNYVLRNSLLIPNMKENVISPLFAVCISC